MIWYVIISYNHIWCIHIDGQWFFYDSPTQAAPFWSGRCAKPYTAPLWASKVCDSLGCYGKIGKAKHLSLIMPCSCEMTVERFPLSWKQLKKLVELHCNNSWVHESRFQHQTWRNQSNDQFQHDWGMKTVTFPELPFNQLQPKSSPIWML